MEALMWIIIVSASVSVGSIAGTVLFEITQPWLDRRHDRTCPDPWRFHGRGEPDFALLDRPWPRHEAIR